MEIIRTNWNRKCMSKLHYKPSSMGLPLLWWIFEVLPARTKWSMRNKRTTDMIYHWYIRQTSYLFKFLKILSIQLIINLWDKGSFDLIQFVPLDTSKPWVSLKISNCPRYFAKLFIIFQSIWNYTTLYLYFICTFRTQSLFNIT